MIGIGKLCIEVMSARAMEANKILQSRMRFKRELFEAVEKEDIDGTTNLLRSFSNLDILNERLIPYSEMTALHLAVGLNSYAVCKILLKYGSNPNSMDCAEKTSPLHLSILYDYEDIVTLLIRAGGNPLILDKEGNSCYDLIYKNRDLKHLVKHLQLAGAVPEKEALVLSPVPFRNFSTPSPERAPVSVHRKSPGRNISNTTISTEESYATCPCDPSPPFATPPPPFIERLRTRLFFDDEVDKSQSVRRTSPRIDRVPVPELDFAYLMTEDESTAGSILTTTTVSSYSPSSSSASTLITEEDSSSSGISEVQMPTIKRANKKSISPPVCAFLQRIPFSKNFSPLQIRTPTKSPSVNEIVKELKQLKLPLTPTPRTPVRAPIPTNYFDNKENIRSGLETPSPSPRKEAVAGFCMELTAALSNFELLHMWGNHKIQFLQSLNSTPTQRTCKSYFNYVLLDPKIIKRSNFSGNYLKSDIIRNGEKFQQFLRAIFYIGKGCGNRPLQHLVEAKAKLMNMRKLSDSEKMERILQIWKSGQGVIVHSIFHHSAEREANVNEAAMLDAIGIKEPQRELTNMKKGSYAGTPAAQWNQKVKNQLGSFLLYKCFCSFVVGDAKVFLPQDV